MAPPPNPILQSPSTRPSPPKSRTLKERASSDDLAALQAVDDAESRARASIRLLDEEHAARLAAERRIQEVEEQLKKIAATQVVTVDPEVRSMQPGALHVVGKGWKFGIPFGAIATVVPIVWAVVQHVYGIEQQLKSLNAAVAGYEKGQESRDKSISKLTEEVALLTNTQARQAGYIAAALPMAGVSVPGAESGAIQVDISREPAPLGAKKRPTVVTHTYVPAPPPDR